MKNLLKPLLKEGSNDYYTFKFQVELGINPSKPLANTNIPITLEMILWSAYVKKKPKKRYTWWSLIHEYTFKKFDTL